MKAHYLCYGDIKRCEHFPFISTHTHTYTYIIVFLKFTYCINAILWNTYKLMFMLNVYWSVCAIFLYKCTYEPLL